MDTPCTEWEGVRNRQGYGMMSHQRGERLAHRAAWVAENGPVPDSLCVLHKCDNPPCVNVDHLFLGTRKDNAQDKVQKGRHLEGERSPNSKLTAAQVFQIRASTDVQWRVARQFGISQTQVSRIKNALRWAKEKE